MNDFRTHDDETTDEIREPVIDYNKVYTYGDYLKLEIEEMVEIIRGKIFRMSPAPKVNHQAISRNIVSNLYLALKGKACQVYHAPIDIVLPIENKKRNKSTTVVQPDICVICNPKIIEEKAVFGTPDFVIEIIAGKNVKKDTQIKFSVYEEAGVGEYWIVFADMRFVEVFLLENGKFQRLNTFSEDDMVPVKTIPGLEISIDDIFDGL
ncbi:MAG: Uma2 family endonuclease [Saprospiraceae bacterium]|jgi:Uma2 family endonuclease|nr:Uma2 family endonuclease [Saprospiraceae bacterium]MBL0026299.1 Uma2 family endonuclease [Saprospiraceae bacterium]